MSFEDKAMHEKVRIMLNEIQDYQATVIRLHRRVALLEQALRGIRRLSVDTDMTVDEAMELVDAALKESNEIAKER